MDNADAQKDTPFSDFTLARPRERNLDDRPRDIQHFAYNVLLDVLVTMVMLSSINIAIKQWSDFGIQRIHKEQLLEKILRNPYREVANFFNQDTTIIGLSAGCVSHDIHFTGYRETNIIVLEKCSNHHICLRFRSGWCQDIPNSSSLERKMIVCNTNRRNDVARFSGNELRQQAPKHELVLLHICEYIVRDKLDHKVVLQ